jgi:hypothetical protein
MPRFVLLKTVILVKFAVETLAGLAFALFPSVLFVIVFGVPLDGPGAYAFRMFGAAIFAMGLACWLACNDSASPAARALVVAMLFYDVAFVIILLVARFGEGLSGIALLPVVLLHSTLGIWSLFCLRKGPTVVRTG